MYRISSGQCGRRQGNSTERYASMYVTVHHVITDQQKWKESPIRCPRRSKGPGASRVQRLDVSAGHRRPQGRLSLGSPLTRSVEELPGPRSAPVPHHHNAILNAPHGAPEFHLPWGKSPRDTAAKYRLNFRMLLQNPSLRPPSPGPPPGPGHPSITVPDCRDIILSASYHDLHHLVPITRIQSKRLRRSPQGKPVTHHPQQVHPPLLH